MNTVTADPTGNNPVGSKTTPAGGTSSTTPDAGFFTANKSGQTAPSSSELTRTANTLQRLLEANADDMTTTEWQDVNNAAIVVRRFV